MEVQLLKVGVCSVPLVRLVEACLDLGLTINLRELNVSVEVGEFDEFLRAYFRACAMMSRTDEGWYLRVGFAVRVLYNGRFYSTKVWYDVEAKGVRYGSLS